MRFDSDDVDLNAAGRLGDEGSLETFLGETMWKWGGHW